MEKQLNKLQKSVAREVIEKGLQKEFKIGVERVEKVINDWKQGNLDDKKAYHKIFSKLLKHDKHIERRYDRMTGSKYTTVLAEQLADNIISIDDLKDFNEHTREAIIFRSGIKTL